MHKRLIPLFVALSLCGCDNPDDFRHTANLPPVDTSGKSGGTASTAPATTSPAPVAVDPRRDAGPTKTVDVAAKDFDSISANGGAEVIVAVGPEYKVSMECSEGSIDGLKVNSDGTTLSISTDRGFNASVAKVTVSTPKLESINASGTMLVKFKGAEGDQIKITSSGSATVEGQGSVQQVVAQAGGSSLIRLVDLQTRTAEVTTSDKAVAQLVVKDSGSATASGESIITITGRPKNVTKERSGKAIINVN